MSQDRRYQLLGRRLVCENRRFDVYFDKFESDGDIIPDFLVVKPKVTSTDGYSGICVLPEMAGRVGLMHGYRHHLDSLVWQAPAGFCDPGETAAQSARRELLEETGLSCGEDSLRSLGQLLPDAGIIAARVSIFLAEGCTPASSKVHVSHEAGVAALEFFSAPELRKLLANNPPMGSATMVACLKYLDRGGHKG